jgi:pimeloyl-ACP methyl ester carboxylesterase
MESIKNAVVAGVQIRRGLVSDQGIEIAYEDWGDPLHPPLLLIMGIGGQMLLWPDDFCRQFVETGMRVIRFDNRDVGLSEKTTVQSRMPLWLVMMRAQLGLRSEVPYSLVDMAADAARLLSWLSIPRAHVLGASMGGMIAQVFAAKFPQHVLSLTILFSSTNQPLLPFPAPSILLKLLRRSVPNASKKDLKEQQKSLLRAIESPAYPMPEHELDELIDRIGERGIDPEGTRRQLYALLGTGDLRNFSKQIKASTLVIHGAHDRMIPRAAGQAVARAIPGAIFKLIPDMAHDMPHQLRPMLIDLIYGHAILKG